MSGLQCFVSLGLVSLVLFLKFALHGLDCKVRFARFTLLVLFVRLCYFLPSVVW